MKSRILCELILEHRLTDEVSIHTRSSVLTVLKVGTVLCMGETLNMASRASDRHARLSPDRQQTLSLGRHVHKFMLIVNIIELRSAV